MLDIIKKYKILLIFILFLFILCLCNNSQASSNVDFTCDGKSYSVPVDFTLQNYMVVNTGYGILLFNTSNDTFYLQNTLNYIYFWSSTDFGSRVSVNVYQYNSNSNSFNSYSNGTSVLTNKIKSFLTANCDVYVIEDTTGILGTGHIYEKFIEPFVVTTDDRISNWNFNDLHINSGSLSSGCNIELNIYYGDSDSIFWIDDTTYEVYSYIQDKIILSDDSDYWDSSHNVSNVDYYIPRLDILNTATIRNNGCLWYVINYYDINNNLIGTIKSKDYFIVGVTSEEIVDDTTDKTLSKMDEQIETSKGIWDTLKSILNFLNPASEDFFVYQLINLLVDAIKMLVIPDEEFLNTWINDMNTWLSDRLGALYYPIDLIIDFFNRIGNINETNTAIIKIPQFDLNFMGYTATVIPEYSYDLNSILENETFKNIHNIYLVVVDVILYLGLVLLAYNTFVDIFGGQYMDDAVQAGYEAYDLYKKRSETDRKSNYIGFRK